MVYQHEGEIEAVVEGFELCTTAKEDFNHRNHLTVAVWYLRNSSLPDALVKMRDGLFRFLDHHGVGREKYHETLTLFWLQLVRDVISQLPPESSTVDSANAVLERLADHRLVFEHYSEERLSSVEAKSSWIPPDLKTLKPHA